MNYEQKYREALSRAKQFSEKPYLEDSKGIVEYIFPELKESEDERIRKELIKSFNEYLKQSEEAWGKDVKFKYVNVKDAIAWLEKQGEQNPISLEDAAKLFLEKLSESPYNNKPITDAQVITKELINFLKDTNTYNPNAINEQKPAEWSEEDINMFGSILSTLGICANNPQIPADVRSIHKKEESWFNELYHRVQPKQEWSEEDEKNNKNILYILNQLKGTAIYKEDKTAENCIDWLKSLKEKYRWKPSDEQLEALEHSLGDYNITIFEDRFEMLKSLYQDLKKLKG